MSLLLSVEPDRPRDSRGEWARPARRTHLDIRGGRLVSSTAELADGKTHDRAPRTDGRG
ncbi:hypothetical protein FM119_08765 [Mycetocola reblochoni REB411]|uniref:Uncharacterized protein n=1 Tax=Mycetocola reblochoni REB411 TaxID=1255698 RepID=A0A1R4JQ37_9MICO|nr:hypothetical protein FM119_08765 [Mycetocola reblochoni REB411]